MNGIRRERKSDARAGAGQIHKRHVGLYMSRTRTAAT